METQSTATVDSSVAKLFSPVQLGPYTLGHRVVMAPLTRMRTVHNNVPTDLMVEYYSQRATKGGYIISEATVVSPNGDGYLGAPAIYTDEQVEGWKKVTSAVHAKGALMFLQLWHVGRQSHSSLQPDGGLPVGPSAIVHDDVAFTANGWVPVTQNRALEIEEIHALVEDFRQGAIRAKAAGFDGVELHGANGYLVDQFLQDGSNQRTDEYGGSIENRVRFMMEVVDAMVSVWGEHRVGVRLGPSGTFGSMSDSNPEALFAYAAEQLNRYDLAYLHIIEPRIDGSILKEEGLQPVAAAQLRKIFKGTIIVAGGFDRASAEAILEKGDADLVAFGRYFLANPDLVKRLKLDLPLNEYDRETFYGGDARGYSDYPFYSHEEAAEANAALPAAV
ncbi:alkene reductase [Hymenobacter terricola]|uniref:alkene reductase n=1 Tax=Hymenobacter terricola TaxID=2819236 RepID=UPI001B30E271|nr:alkene reductase [Hymenobacter terricola]